MTEEKSGDRRLRSSRENRHLSRWAVVVFLVAVAVYANTLFNGFVYDDADQVVANPWIRSVRHIPEIFTSGSWAYSGVKSNYYRPVMHLLYMLGYSVFGPAPAGFHLLNILFHGGVSVLVLLVTARLLGDRSTVAPVSYLNAPAIAGLLFATHPVHTEAVAWISGIPDLSFTFFGLLALLLYMSNPEMQRRRPSISSLLSLGFFFVALLSKETALVLPLLMVIYEATVQKDNGLRHLFGRVVPYIALVALYVILRTSAIGGLAPVVRFRELSVYQTVLNVFPLFLKYAGKLFLPIGLSVFHGFEPATSLLSFGVLASVFFVTMIVVVAGILRRKSKVALFGLALTVVPLIPVLYIPNLGENPFAERYLYFPSVGFVVLCAVIVSRLSASSVRSSLAVGLACLALAVTYAAGTTSRNTVWKNEHVLWQDAVEKSPSAPVAQFNYAAVLQSEGHIKRAIVHYLIALRLKPSDKVHYNLGLAYLTIGQRDKAIEQFRAAIRLNPNFVTAYNSLGAALLNAGAYREAIEQFRAAIRMNPRYPDSYYNLGVSYERLGMNEKAAASYRQAAELSPDNPQIRERITALRGE